MASYNEIFEKKLDWQMPFQRTGKFPLDRSTMFASYEDAVKYAEGNKDNPDSRGLQGTSYVGQVITVYENDVVTVYKINADRTLEEVGSATAGDDKSIALEGKTLSLKNFGKKYYKYVVTLPDVATVDELPADAAAGTYCKVAGTWYIKNDTWAVAVKYPEGDSHYILVEDGTFPAGLQAKTRLNENGVIELAWYEPSSTTVEGLAEQMSSLTETVNTVQKVASDNAKELEENVVKKEEGKGLSTNDYTTAEKEKLAGVSAGAQVNVIEKVKVKKGDTSTDLTPDGSKAVEIEIPTKLSEFTNDKNFIDNTVGNLVNYYLKSETYKKDEVDAIVAAVAHLKMLKVEALPTENISTSTIYLVPNNRGEDGDIYNEYIYVEGAWELIGDTRLSLEGYLKTNDNGSSLIVEFFTSETRELPISGQPIGIILGAVVKYLSDLKDVAFSGSYNDLSDTPEVLHERDKVLSAGETTLTFECPDARVITAYDAVTHEQVFVDIAKNGVTITVSIAEAYNHNINIEVLTFNN